MINSNKKDEFLKMLINQDIKFEDISNNISDNYNNYLDIQNTEFLNYSSILLSKVTKILTYKSYIIAIVSDGINSEFLIFDENINYITRISRSRFNDELKLIGRILEIKIDKDGTMYGLQYEENLIQFFIFNNFMDYIFQIEKDDDSEFINNFVFYQSRFVISIEILITDGVKKGNEILRQILTKDSKFGINRDVQNNLSFSIIVEEKINNISNLWFMKFTTDLGIDNLLQTDWEYNEKIIIDEGAAAINLNNLSQLDILTDEKEINGAISVGSAIVSIAKEGTGETIEYFDRKISLTTSKLANGSKPNDDWSTILSNSQLQPLFNKYDEVVANATKITSLTGEMIVKGDFDSENKVPGESLKPYPSFSVSGKKFVYPRSEIEQWLQRRNTLLFQIKNENDDISTDSLPWQRWTCRFQDNANINASTSTKKYWLVDGVAQSTPDVVDLIILEAYGGSVIRQNGWLKMKNQPISLPDYEPEAYNELTISINWYVKGEIKVVNLAENTIAQIVITKDPVSGNLKFNIYQSISKSQKTNPAIFIDSNQFYVPVQNEDTNKFEIFEFIGILSLTDPGNIPPPKKLEFNSTPPLPIDKNNQLFITSVDDFEELNNQKRTIVGSGYEGNTTQQLIHLFNSVPNKSFDKINQKVYTRTEAQMLFINQVAAIRQKDLIFLYSFNKDFSRVNKTVIIYPNSFNPYTYNSYSNTNKSFALERINISRPLKPPDSSSPYQFIDVFDHKFLDFVAVGNTILATTTANSRNLNAYTYLNSIPQKIKIKTRTNEDLFTLTNPIYKSLLEELTLNFQLSIKFIDDTGKVPKENLKISNLIQNILLGNNNAYKEIQLDYIYIFTRNGPTTTIPVDNEVIKFISDGSNSYLQGEFILKNQNNLEIESILLFTKSGVQFFANNFLQKIFCNFIKFSFKIKLED